MTLRLARLTTGGLGIALALPSLPRWCETIPTQELVTRAERGVAA